MMGDSAVYCLNECGHTSPARLRIEHHNETEVEVVWERLTAEEALLFRDKIESVQYGAYGVVFLVLRHMFGGYSLTRSVIGSGYDWWVTLDDPRLPFADPIRLEVSGILNNPLSITGRVAAKVKQTLRSDAFGSPTLVAVVEFSTPSVRIKRVE